MRLLTIVMKRRRRRRYKQLFLPDRHVGCHMIRSGRDAERRRRRRGSRSGGGDAFLSESVEPRLLPAFEPPFRLDNATRLLFFGQPGGGDGSALLGSQLTASLASEPQRDVNAEDDAEEERSEADGQMDSGLEPVDVDDGHGGVRHGDVARESALECARMRLGVLAEELVAVNVGRVAASDHVGVKAGRLQRLWRVRRVVIGEEELTVQPLGGQRRVG